MQNRRRSIAQPLRHILSWDLTRSTASVSHCSVFWIACWITLAFSFTFARRILGKTNKWLQSEPSSKIYGSGCSSLYWVWHIFVSVDIGYHNRWNRQVGVRHPNLWVFIRKLKDEQRHCRRVLRAADRGDAPPASKRCYRLLQQRITRLRDDYCAGHRTIGSYWKAVAHAIHSF